MAFVGAPLSAAKKLQLRDHMEQERQLTPEGLAELRRRLEARRDALIRAKRAAEEIEYPDPESEEIARVSPEELERIDFPSGIIPEEEITDEVTEIDDAIVRMQAEQYGVCDRCGKEISFDRLEQFPYTRHCSNCARIMEKQKRDLEAEGHQVSDPEY